MRTCSFVIEVPNPAPTRFGLVVWRPDGSTLAQDAAWVVTCNDVATGVDDDALVPAVTASRLVSAAPNPFNPMTMIAFEVAAPGRCELTVHDVRGRLVRTLVAAERPAVVTRSAGTASTTTASVSPAASTWRGCAPRAGRWICSS